METTGNHNSTGNRTEYIKMDPESSKKKKRGISLLNLPIPNGMMFVTSGNKNKINCFGINEQVNF